MRNIAGGAWAASRGELTRREGARAAIRARPPVEYREAHRLHSAVLHGRAAALAARHAALSNVEQDRIEAWLARMREAADSYDLAVEIAECQRLIKGYGDTHERGPSIYEVIMQFADRHRDRADLARTVRELRAAALADDEGAKLEAALGAQAG